MNLPNLTLSQAPKILALINEAPGNFFALEANGTTVLPAKYYKDNRNEFLTRANGYLNSELSSDGIYTINNGTTRKVRPIFYIQKGINTQPAIIQAPMKEEKSDLALVKENAELKAKVQYLELQLADLQEALEEAETDLSEAPDPAEKPNPWYALAEQLAPVAGQIISVVAAKYLQPDIQNNGTQNGSGNDRPRNVEMRYPRTNAQFDSNQVQSEQPNNSGNL